MPAVQLHYPGYHGVAFQGMVATQEPHDIITRTAAVGSIGFGVPVFRAPTVSDMAVQPYIAGAIFDGISVQTYHTPASGPDASAVGASVAVLKSGVIYVTASVAVTPGQPVYYDTNGAWTNVSSGNTAVVGATFDGTAAAAALVRVRLK